jgi:four helix bundle protein
MSIRRFEDIQAWQVSRELCKNVYKLSASGKFAKDFSLRDQVRRAAVSVMANIAEGFDSHSNQEFVQFLYYALRSASELQSHFYIAHDQEYLTDIQFKELYDHTSKIKGMLFAFIDYLRAHKKLAAGSRSSQLRTSNLERL